MVSPISRIGAAARQSLDVQRDLLWRRMTMAAWAIKVMAHRLGALKFGGYSRRAEIPLARRQCPAAARSAAVPIRAGSARHILESL